MPGAGAVHHIKSGGPKQAAVSFDVRFTPKSGHRSGHSRRQLLANIAIAASQIGSLVTTLGNAQHIMLS